MRYTVVVAQQALQDAEEYASYIREQSNDGHASNAWWNGLLDAFASLETFPARCPPIPENGPFAEKLRQLPYASHRVIFVVEARIVNIVRIYPFASQPLRSLRQRAHARKHAQI